MTTSEADHDRDALLLARLFERADLTRAVIDAATALVDGYRDHDISDAWADIMLADLCAAVADYRRRR